MSFLQRACPVLHAAFSQRQPVCNYSLSLRFPPGLRQNFGYFMLQPFLQDNLAVRLDFLSPYGAMHRTGRRAGHGVELFLRRHSYCAIWSISDLPPDDRSTSAPCRRAHCQTSQESPCLPVPAPYVRRSMLPSATFFKTRDVWNSGDNTQSLPICGTDGFDWKSPRSFLRLEIKISAVGFCVVALLRTFSAFR